MRTTALLSLLVLSACASDSGGKSAGREATPRNSADSSARIAHVSELPPDHRELLRAYGKGGEAWEEARERALADPALASFLVENLFLELARAHRTIGGRESERARAARDRAHAELARLGEAAAPTLVAALEVADDVSAQLAIDVLADVGRPALAPLVAGLSHAQPQARRRAADALARVQHGALEEPHVRNALIAARDDREWFVRAQVARALGARGSRDMETAPWRNALVAMLGDADAAVVEAAASGLAQLADPRAIGALVERLSRAAQAGEPRVFRAAQNALVQLTGQPPQPSIDAWAAWWRANRAHIERTGAR